MAEHIIVNGEAVELLEDGHFPLYSYYPIGSTMFDASCCPPRLVPIDADPEEMGRTLMRLVPQAPYFVFVSAGPEDRIEARKIIDNRTNSIAASADLVHTFVNTASSPFSTVAGASASAVAYPNDTVYNVIPSMMQIFPAQRQALIDRRLEYLSRATVSRNAAHLPYAVVREQLEHYDLRFLTRYIIAHGLEPNTLAYDFGRYFETTHTLFVVHSNVCDFGTTAVGASKPPCRSIGVIELQEAYETHKLLATRYLQFQNDYMYVVGSDRRPLETLQMEPLPTAVGPAPIREHPRPNNNNININNQNGIRPQNDGRHHFNNQRGMNGNFNSRPVRMPMHGPNMGHNDRHGQFNNNVGPNRPLASHINAFRDTRESRAEPMMNSVSSQNNTPTNVLNVPLPRSAHYQGPNIQPSFHNGNSLANPHSVIYCIGHIIDELTDSSVQDQVFIPSQKSFETISNLIPNYGAVYLFVIYPRTAMVFGLARVTSKLSNKLNVKWLAPHRNIPASTIPKMYIEGLGMGELQSGSAKWFDGLRVAESSNGEVKGNLDACRRLHDYLEGCPILPLDSPSGSPTYNNRGAPLRTL